MVNYQHQMDQSGKQIHNHENENLHNNQDFMDRCIHIYQLNYQHQDIDLRSSNPCNGGYEGLHMNRHNQIHIDVLSLMRNKGKHKLNYKFYQQVRHNNYQGILGHIFFLYWLNYNNRRYHPSKDTHQHKHLSQDQQNQLGIYSNKQVLY